ncbi:hypothetical protein IscW_ISCW019881 [Ixodes scapularis]|uniref:Uncharacterized protein n=1 Tax=Ixodes scapularis TaxID=6945 RepID=B7PU20_IXOSC|nr:hypothetical protein IscW_ISCW019881 [Ixodes scapularis]|eukprot:XP_002405334.1 hypothetical protein IscW_ISCW019881 [Ixodes scapularis]
MNSQRTDRRGWLKLEANRTQPNSRKAAIEPSHSLDCNIDVPSSISYQAVVTLNVIRNRQEIKKIFLDSSPSKKSKARDRVLWSKRAFKHVIEKNNLPRLHHTNDHSGGVKKYSDLRQVTSFATAPTTCLRESHQRRGGARSDLDRLVPGFPAWRRPFCWSREYSESMGRSRSLTAWQEAVKYTSRILL